MAVRNKNFISINRKGFGKKSSRLSFLITAGLIVFGIIGTVVNWRNGVSAALVMGLVYLLQKYFRVNWWLMMGIALGGLIGFSYGWDLFLGELLITAIGFSFVFFFKSSLAEMKENDLVEIFYLDSQKLKCLSTNDNDYKGYALNPKGFLKTFDSKFIKSFNMKGNHLLISIGDEIIRPRELNKDNLEEIKEFISINFPDLWENDEVYRENLKNENRFYLHKFLIVSPVLAFSLIIYFWADNGRNAPLTYLFFALMILSCYFMYWLLRKK